MDGFGVSDGSVSEGRKNKNGGRKMVKVDADGRWRKWRVSGGEGGEREKWWGE